jgi:hypothetical protein
MDLKTFPIGIDDFEKLRENDFYYVDKTLLIKVLLDNRSEVSLFTRPRRFGKSLNLSMLQHYFEISRHSKPLFEGLKIMDMGERYLVHMNRYPVIMLSFKAVDQNTFEASFQMLKDELQREFRRHRYLLESDKISEEQKDKISAILKGLASEQRYITCIQLLSECLVQHYGEKVVILIDEYDVPLERSYFKNYYEDMLGIIRPLLNTALKTNTALAFSVMTGCLRISKESFFTGLNNPDIISILSEHYGEFFGFTEPEIEQVLNDYYLESIKKEMKEWYNGYVFGNVNVYNPWSVIKYLRDKCVNRNSFPVPHWSNTSANSIIRTLVENAKPKDRRNIEKLIRGETITVPIHEDITYEDITTSSDNLWNFLFFTGYLRKNSMEFIDDTLFLVLAIPNKEVRYVYKRKIAEWMKDTITSQKHTQLYESVQNGDASKFAEELNICLGRSISYMDNYESFYHGFLIGLLDNMGEYEVRSNRESGNGRGDIFIMSSDNKKFGAVIEIKLANSFQLLDKSCDQALGQIAEKNYVGELRYMGYQKIFQYGIAFYKKNCAVKVCDE